MFSEVICMVRQKLKKIIAKQARVYTFPQALLRVEKWRIFYDDDHSEKEMDRKGRDMTLMDKPWQIREKAYGIKFDWEKIIIL